MPKLFLACCAAALAATASAQGLTISVDPLNFLGLLASTGTEGEARDADIRNLGSAPR
jgi:hypothetical protein